MINIRQAGGILVMVLVLLTVMLIMMIAGSRFIASRYHQTVNQSQREQAYEIAESGVHYSLWRLNVANIAPNELTPITNYPVTDSPDDHVVGSFTVTYQTSMTGTTETVIVTSVGNDAVLAGVEQRIVATLIAYNGGPFTVQAWNEAL